MLKRLSVLLLVVPAVLAVTSAPASADPLDYLTIDMCGDPEDCPGCPGIWVSGYWYSFCL